MAPALDATMIPVLVHPYQAGGGEPYGFWEPVAELPAKTARESAQGSDDLHETSNLGPRSQALPIDAVARLEA